MLMKLWIYANHYVNCRVKNCLKEDHRSYIQLMQLRKESLQKNSDLYGIQTLDLMWYQCSALPNFSGFSFFTRTTCSLNFFFRVSFRNCLPVNCVYNCDDHPSSNFSLCSSHYYRYMIFIYSLFHKLNPHLAHFFCACYIVIIWLIWMRYMTNLCKV